MRYFYANISQKLRFFAICPVCQQYHKNTHAICIDCYKQLTPVGSACQYCAYPLPDNQICGHCCKTRPDFDRVIAACQYKEPLRSLLHEFKYREGLYLSSLLTDLIVTALPKDAQKTQCLFPVPMHPKRLRQRGFNHALELTKRLSRILNRPYEPMHCKKIINTPPQAQLRAKERRRNLQNAFYVKPTPYQYVTLIDDLVTTGSTVGELAKLLKKQGVQRVDVWCCARAIDAYR